MTVIGCVVAALSAVALLRMCFRRKPKAKVMVYRNGVWSDK